MTEKIKLNVNENANNVVREIETNQIYKCKTKQDLTMIELFSGIGAQKRGIDNTELYNLSVIATSDVDKEAVVEYAAIHHGLTNEMVENYGSYPSREEMIEELKSRNIGMDFDKNKMYDWNKLLKKKTKDIEKYWLAMKLQNNLGDISKIEQLPNADCWFYSSPCQCFSLAGKQDGIDATCNACGQKYNPMEIDVEHRYICPNCGSDDIKGTRSGLLLEVERLLIKSIETNTSPKYLCLENVKNLVGKKFKSDFDAWVKRLEHLGYNTYWAVLNAKECGIPQNRERVFAFSIRKDIDNCTYTFPSPFDNGLRLKHVLENNVDERYYINTERASNLIQQLIDKGQLKGQRVCCDSTINDPNVREISNTILARYDAGIVNHKQTGLAVVEPQIELQPILVKNQGTEYVKDLDESVTLKARDWKGWDNYGSVAIVESENINDSKRLGGLWDGETKHQAGSVWDSNGMAPTLDTAQGGGRQPHIIEENFKPICVGNTTPSGKSQCNAVYSTEGVSQTLCAGTHGYATGSILEQKPAFVIGSTQKNTFVGNGEISSALTSAMGMGGGHIPMIGLEEQEPEVIGIKQATKKGYIECELPGCADLSYPSSTTRRGRVQDNGQICPTITATETGIHYIESIYRIRKLTPRECFVLMGFEFEDWDKCVEIGASNTAGYKAAGNSIVTNCISLLFEHLYKAQYDDTYICTDEKMQNFIQPQVKA